MKEQEKTPKNNYTKGRWANSRKRIQNNDIEDDSRSQKNNGEDARSVYQRPRRIKEQTEMNNILEAINSRITEAEEWISDLEDRMVETIATKQNIGKRMKVNENSLRNLWDNIKLTNIFIIGVQERGEREKGHEKVFEEIIA